MLRSLPLVLLGLCVGTGVLAEEPTPTTRSLTVYHRLVSQPLSTDGAVSLTFLPLESDKWYERGRIDLPSSSSSLEASFVPSPDAWKAFFAPETAAYKGKNAAQVGGERYQVAVRDPAWGGNGEGEEEGELSFVSVDPCKLYTSSSSGLDEFLTLSWTSSPSHEGGVFAGALSYRTSTSDDSPACDPKASEKERQKYVFGPRKEKEGKVVVKLVQAEEVKPEEPVRPKQAKEQQPVQLDEDGKVIPPPPQQSFIKKYWMYIVPVLLVFLMTTSEPPAEGGGQGGGGGAGKK